MGDENLVGTGRQTRHTAPVRHQRSRGEGSGVCHGAAAASGGRDGAGTRGHATIEPRVAWLLLVVPPEIIRNIYYISFQYLLLGVYRLETRMFC